MNLQPQDQDEQNLSPNLSKLLLPEARPLSKKRKTKAPTPPAGMTVMLDSSVMKTSETQLPVAALDEGTDGERQNINISAYRVLYILRLLVQHQSLNLVELNSHLFNNPMIGRTYNNETITKYINTLRKVGCYIPRTSSRNNYQYMLMENPFSIELDEDELRVARQVLSALAFQSDETLHTRYHQFLEKVAWMLKEPQKQDFRSNLVLTAPPSTVQHRRQLLRRFRDFCSDARSLQLEYQQEPMIRVTLWVEPIRVLQEDGQVFLLGVEQTRREQVKLNLEKILGFQQSPSKVATTGQSVNVVFQLYGRLAKSYRLYPEEELVFAQGETVQIKTKTDDLGSLLNRLLKYNVHCQVISPACARKEMRQRIQTLIDTCHSPA